MTRPLISSQHLTGGRLAGITAKLTVRLEEATYFDTEADVAKLQAATELMASTLAGATH
jgi:hypothetical protein